jgi:hypothetical protein
MYVYNTYVYNQHTQTFWCCWSVRVAGSGSSGFRGDVWGTSVPLGVVRGDGISVPLGVVRGDEKVPCEERRSLSGVSTCTFVLVKRVK